VEKRERLNKMEAMLKQEEVAIGLLNAQAQEQMEKAKEPYAMAKACAYAVDVSDAAPQAHGIINVALHWEYSPGIIFIFSQGRKDLYHV
jgi:hypothetical protein